MGKHGNAAPDDDIKVAPPSGVSDRGCRALPKSVAGKPAPVLSRVNAVDSEAIIAPPRNRSSISTLQQSCPRPREKIVTFACQLRGLSWRIDFLHPVPWRGRDDLSSLKETGLTGQVGSIVGASARLCGLFAAVNCIYQASAAETAAVTTI